MKATWPARSGKAPCRRPAGLCAAAACVLALGLPVGLLAGSGSARASGAEQDATAFQMTPGHTGASSDPMGPQWTEAWSATGSGPFSYALIAGGQVSTLVESSSPTLEAYKPAGDARWTGRLPWEPRPRGSRYTSGRVFEQSTDLMSSYNAANGDLDWSATIPTQYLFSSSPTAANGIVYTDGAGLGRRPGTPTASPPVRCCGPKR